MNTIEFENLKINYNKEINVFPNKDTKKVAFISKDYEEIHAILEVKENQEFQVYPNWNVKFSINEKEITIDLNYQEEE